MKRITSKNVKKAILFCALTTIMFNAVAQTKKTEKQNSAISATKTVAVQQRNESFSVLGRNFLDLGVGLGTYYKGLPFGGSFEHGFTDHISAGVFADYSSYNYTGSGFKLNILYTGVRGSYHFAELLNVTNPNFDPYGGVSLGYYHVSFNGVDVGAPYSSSVFFGVHAGVRYLFSDHVGGFAELGYGVSALKVGVSFKF
jgi:hypothetical protein